MNKNDTPMKRAGVPALLSILMLCMMVAGGLHAQSVGDFMISKKVNATGPHTLKVWAGANSILWGTDALGDPGNVTLSGDFSIVAGELQWTGGESADAAGLDLLGAATASAARTILELGEAALATSTNTEGVAGPGLVLSRAEHTHNLSGPYITGTLPISKGGTGITNGPTNGQLLIGVTTGNQWSRATLTQGTGITVTNGAGSITVAVNEAGLTHNNIGGTLGASKGGTGITSLSSGIATFLGAASSANLRAALTDETGTGGAVFATGPTFSGATMSGTLGFPDGNFVPSWGDVTSSGAGILLGSSGGINVAPGYNALILNQGNQLGWDSTGAPTSGTMDTGLKRGSAGVVKVTNGSSGYGALDSNKVVLNGTTQITSGSGTPEGVVAAPVGSLFLRTDGSTSTTLYVKTSGSGNTGWTAK